MLKKLLLTLLTAAILFSSSAAYFVKPAHAQNVGPWFDQDFIQWYTKVYDTENPNEIFGERYTAAQVQWVFYSIPALFINASIGPDLAVAILTYQPIEAILKAAGRLIGILRTLYDLLTYSDTNSSSFAKAFSTNPISSVNYFRHVGERLSIIPQAEAQQGFGFQAAGITLQLWNVTRNLAYTFLTIAVVALAFMILFRVKLNPQTVITVQSALPKVVLAIILITFSYAIAGLLIDLMYVIIGLLAGILTSSGLSDWSFDQMFRGLTERNILILYLYYWIAFVFVSLFNIGAMLGELNLAGAFVGIFFFLFSVISILWLIVYTIKGIILLLKTFVEIVLLIVVAPLQILLGVIIPSAGFGSWLKKMVSKLAIYPTVGLLFALAFFFLSAGLGELGTTFLNDALIPFDMKGATFLTPNMGWFPGLIPQPWRPPLTLGTESEELLWLAASFVIIGMIPKAGEKIEELIMGRAGKDTFGMAIGEAAQKGVQIGAGTAADYKFTQWEQAQQDVGRGVSRAIDVKASLARAGRRLTGIKGG